MIIYSMSGPLSTGEASSHQHAILTLKQHVTIGKYRDQITILDSKDVGLQKSMFTELRHRYIVLVNQFVILIVKFMLCRFQSHFLISLIGQVIFLPGEHPLL